MRAIDKIIPAKIIGLVLLVSACLALPAYLIYQSAKGLIIEELNKNAKNIATTAAIFIEQDIRAYKGLPSDNNVYSDDFDTEYYQVLLKRFEKIEKESGAAKIFTEKRMADKDKAFILNAAAPPPHGPPIGSSKNMSQEELRAFDEGVMTHSGLMRDQSRGEFITGYAPIIDDKTGEPVGIVGVEFTVVYAGKITDGIRNIIIVSFLVIMLLTTFVVNSLINSRRKYYKEDYLTGLFTKRFFEKGLTRAIRHIEKTGRKLYLIMIDVDFFKEINDTRGHTIGDSVLKSVAQHIKKHVRSSDFCCRFGGDEFIITLISADKPQALEIAERIRKEIENMTLDTVGVEAVTLSVGIAEYVSGQNAQALIDCADKALYISKNNGRNRTTIYDAYSI